MSKAIFLFTFRRFLDWQQALIIAMWMALGAFCIGSMWSSSFGPAAEFARWLLFGPVVPFMVSMGITMPQIANSARRKDGEYLSLLFSRPISRTSYVITKWLSAALFTFLFVMTIAALSAIASQVMAAIFSTHPAGSMFDVYGLCDALCNSLSFSALVTMFSAMPPRARAYFAMFVSWFILIATTSLGAGALISGGSFSDAAKSVSVVVRFLGSFGSVSVDSYHILNASQSPLSTSLIYMSNVVLYLTVASLIMCMREFFYSND